MKFETASSVEQVCYEMRLADWSRGFNRSLINDLFNGLPPYSQQEVRDNNIEINFNDLSSTRLGHDARMQGIQAVMKPGNFFSCRTDAKPAHKRNTWQTIVTKEANRPMRKSPVYFETVRAQVGQNVLHGISPTHWDDRDKWNGRLMGVEDVLIPSRTLLTMENLPFFAIYQSYTGHQMQKMTSGPKVDPAWNMEMVKYMIEWVDDEARTLMGTTWPEVWSPEKMGERIKEDGGLYASDAIPTIDVYDFYFWNDDGKAAGWNRRMIVDTYGGPGAGGTSNKEPPRYSTDDKKKGAKGHFLYNPGDRKYGDKLSDIITFQFADLSAVFPARYHSVRSLGMLLYAVCHLQNRLRCKFNEAVFEALMMYMRVKSADDVERALKIELISRGIIDESVSFLKPDERWQVNEALAQMGLAENEKLIMQNSSSYTSGQAQRENEPERKNRWQVMAEANASVALISPAMMQANKYKGFEYEQIFRRMCRKHSRDADVRKFRVNCLKQGVPEEILVPEAWEIEPEQIMGAGNKTLEMSMAQQMMELRPLLDPEPQRQVLRNVVLAITDSAAEADQLVPDEPVKVTDSVWDAQKLTDRLMRGLPTGIKTGVNHIEYVETLLADMAFIIKQIEGRGGMAKPEEVPGLENMGGYIAEHIKIIAQDPEEKQRVKQEGDNLSNLMNLVKAYAQRLQEQQQKQQGNGHGAPDPETQAKLQGKLMIDKAKAQNMRESHGMRTAQKQVQFEQKMKQDAQTHQLEMRKKMHETHVETAAADLQNAAEMRRKRFAGSED
jgi:hypothetical protein